MGMWGLLLLIVLPAQASASVGDEDCEERFEEAEEVYLDGEFNEAVMILTDCYYRDDLPPALGVEIARLVALSHLNSDNLDAARRSVLRILSFAPNYEADAIQDPPSYVSMVNIVRRQVQGGELDVPEIAAEERRGQDWLYVVGAGVVTVVVTTVLAVMGGGNGNGGGESLPGPPDLP